MDVLDTLRNVPDELEPDDASTDVHLKKERSVFLNSRLILSVMKKLVVVDIRITPWIVVHMISGM